MDYDSFYAKSNSNLLDHILLEITGKILVIAQDTYLQVVHVRTDQRYHTFEIVLKVN
jgi:hypothetical protein